jgi:hypothetical protein
MRLIFHERKIQATLPLATPLRRFFPHVPVPEFSPPPTSIFAVPAIRVFPSSLLCPVPGLCSSGRAPRRTQFQNRLPGIRRPPEEDGEGRVVFSRPPSAVRRGEPLTLVIPGRLPLPPHPPEPAGVALACLPLPPPSPPSVRAPALRLLRARGRAPCAFLFTKEISSGRWNRYGGGNEMIGLE